MNTRKKHLRGFTLTEILIVIGIIVLLLAIAVPTMRVLTGGRSIDGAENQISALLGRARGEAIAMQEERGVMFYYDPDTQRVMLAQVVARDAVSGSLVRDVFLDLVPDQDHVPLPLDVSAQLVDDYDPLHPPGTPDDRYIGFNQKVDPTTGTNPDTYVFYGGVILFDVNGQIINHTYGFRASPEMFGLLYRNTVLATADIVPQRPTSATPVMRSQFGLVLFDEESFKNVGHSLTDSQITGIGDETTEETWLDQNSVPLMINRNNGTLVRGE